MIQFLYPLGFLAATAIIIPVIIHLWNIKEGKTLRIGSISLLGESSRQSSRSFRITDWPLLILRCLLFVALAFLLGQPLLRTAFGGFDDKGWVVIERPVLKNAYKSYKSTIDSLINRGYELRELSVGFPQLNLSDSSATPESNALSYTSLIKELNSSLPAGYRVYAFADRRLARYGDEVPEVSINLRWQMIPAGDSTSTRVTKAYFTVRDSIRTFLTHSSPSGNYIEMFNLSDQVARLKQIEVRTDSGRTMHKTAGQSGWITADTSTVNVVIYVAGRENDAAYLSSAIMAIREFTQMKISLLTVNSLSKISSPADVIFCLSGDQTEASLVRMLKPGGSIFRYAPGKEDQISSTLNTHPGDANFAATSGLYKRIYSDNIQGETLWSDGFGMPVLTREHLGETIQYHLYTRLDPQYTGLVWNDDFVKALMPLIIPAGKKNIEYTDNLFDYRQLPAGSQVLKSAGFGATDAHPVYTEKPLATIVWLIAMLLFAAERFITLNRSRQEI